MDEYREALQKLFDAVDSLTIVPHQWEVISPAYHAAKALLARGEPAAAEKARDEARAQPISTAPKSGKPILLFVSLKGFGGKDASHWSTGLYSFEPCVIDGKLMGCEEGFKCDADQCIPLNQEVFTHWMPLPLPPAATGETNHDLCQICGGETPCNCNNTEGVP